MGTVRVAVQGAYDTGRYTPLTGDALKQATTKDVAQVAGPGGGRQTYVGPAATGGYTGEIIPSGESWVAGAPGWAFGRPPADLDTQRWAPSAPVNSPLGMYISDLHARERAYHASVSRDTIDPRTGERFYIRPESIVPGDIWGTKLVYEPLPTYTSPEGTPTTRPPLPDYIDYMDRENPADPTAIDLTTGMPFWFRGPNPVAPRGWQITPYGFDRAPATAPKIYSKAPPPIDRHQQQGRLEDLANTAGDIGDAYGQALRNAAAGRTIGGGEVSDSPRSITARVSGNSPLPASSYDGVQGASLYDEFLRRIANDNRG